MIRFREIVSEYKFPPQRLRTALSRAPQYGANERGIERLDTSAPRYIRITDIDSNSQLIPGLGVAAEEAEGRYRLEVGDLLIARSGNTVGKSLLIENDLNAIFAGYLIRFKIDPERLNPKYTSIFTQLPIYWKWVEATRRMTGQPNINAEEYGRLELPEPPMSIQNEIVRIYDIAFISFKQKLTDAADLLASIDDYLLEALGIDLPPEPESTIANRMFRTSASELGGWRFDPRVHQYNFDLTSNKYPNSEIGRVCFLNPRTSYKGLNADDTISFVPMNAISDRLGLIEKTAQRPVVESKGYTTFQENDLLWAKITPCMENGKSAVAENLVRGLGFGSTEYHVLRVREGQLETKYLHALLRMSRVRKAAIRYFTGSSGHQRVDEDFLRTLQIPIPAPEIQQRIVSEIEHRRIEAVKLEKEAQAELESAKKQIETILLGGTP